METSGAAPWQPSPAPQIPAVTMVSAPSCQASSSSHTMTSLHWRYSFLGIFRQSNMWHVCFSCWETVQWNDIFESHDIIRNFFFFFSLSPAVGKKSQSLHMWLWAVLYNNTLKIHERNAFWLDDLVVVVVLHSNTDVRGSKSFIRHAVSVGSAAGKIQPDLKVCCQIT